MPDLQRRVRQFFATANLPAVRHVGVEVKEDSIVLTGSVCTFYEKQMATEFARRVAGVVSIVNAIDVRLRLASDAAVDNREEADKHKLGAIRPRSSEVVQY